VRAAPLGLALVAVAAAIDGLGPLAVSGEGVVLAIASGALASGVGYSLWYAALRGLAATQAAVVQLLTPVLAAAGGAVLLGESVSARLALAAAAILGGVGLALRR
jgi:drug/metabolite transporter (DMT)-like permease